MNPNLLTSDTFELFAAHYYDNPECSSRAEFEEDLNRFKYIKRILRKYKKTGLMDDKSIRLLMNHIILVLNLWGVKPGSLMLFFKIEADLHPPLKTYLMYLHSLPRVVGKLNTDNIPIDTFIVTKLRQI